MPIRIPDRIGSSQNLGVTGNTLFILDIKGLCVAWNYYKGNGEKIISNPMILFCDFRGFVGLSRFFVRLQFLFDGVMTAYFLTIKFKAEK